MSENKIRLGVNIDHIATLRQARGTFYPCPVEGALVAEAAGADGITLHLREDRRHIQDSDVGLLKSKLDIPMNLEMAATEEMIAFACRIKPDNCCLVPEKREELTTEGGLDVLGQIAHIKDACKRLSNAGIAVSLFIDPDKEQIDAAQECGAPVVELHTGQYAQAVEVEEQQMELKKIVEAADYAHSKGLIVNAGHGLHYYNTRAIAAIPVINELNIGHSIIAESVFLGLPEAVSKMKDLIMEASPVTSQ